MTQPKCEHCKNPAVTEAHDHQETAPGKWALIKVVPLCAEHARPQRLTFLNGRTFQHHEEVTDDAQRG